MRVAIFSAGPSLLEQCDAHAPSRFDWSIAVNAAAEKLACDAWCIADGHMARTFDPLGEPAIFTIGRHAQAVRDCAKFRHLDVHDLSAYAAECGVIPPDGWQTYSAPAAIVLAGCAIMKMGHADNSLDIYGVDMAGDEDCTGRVGRKRSPERWARETKYWDRAIACIESFGVHLRVHRPQPAVEEVASR